MFDPECISPAKLFQSVGASYLKEFNTQFVVKTLGAMSRILDTCLCTVHQGLWW